MMTDKEVSSAHDRFAKRHKEMKGDFHKEITRSSGAKTGSSSNTDWIGGATANKGGLHRSLDVPAGKNIPVAKVKAAGKQKLHGR